MLPSPDSDLHYRSKVGPGQADPRAVRGSLISFHSLDTVRCRLLSTATSRPQVTVANSFSLINEPSGPFGVELNKADPQDDDGCKSL